VRTKRFELPNDTQKPRVATVINNDYITARDRQITFSFGRSKCINKRKPYTGRGRQLEASAGLEVDIYYYVKTNAAVPQ